LNNLASTIIVKGEVDYIAKDGEIIETVEKPFIPSMEATGGTGDTITGLISAFVYAGLKPHEAAIIAAKANRMAGKFSQATPSTKIWEVISQFPAVFKEYLCGWTGIFIL
jgi:NAD(P)H-hydrate repair Nnr-like enzyme with NAD(P)H-hydrate dehydratase domain